MRQRLSAKFSIGQKLVLTLIPAGIILSTGVTGKIANLLPELAAIPFLLSGLLALACFAIVQFLLKDRTVIEFDDEILYIVRVNGEQERAIPLPHLIKLSLRPPKLEIGAYWFWTYSLTFTDETGSEDKIRFMMMVGRSSYQRFLPLVLAQNPNFEVKNWTFY